MRSLLFTALCLITLGSYADDAANSTIRLGTVTLSGNAGNYQGFIIGGGVRDFASNIGISRGTLYFVDNELFDDQERFEQEGLRIEEAFTAKGKLYFGMLWRF